MKRRLVGQCLWLVALLWAVGWANQHGHTVTWLVMIGVSLFQVGCIVITALQYSDYRNRPTLYGELWEPGPAELRDERSQINREPPA